MDSLSQIPLTLNFTKAGLTAGTTSTITTTATLQYMNKGKSYSKTAITNGATPTTDAQTGVAFPPLSANQGTVVLLGLDTSGNLVASQGQIQALDVNGSFILSPNFGELKDTHTPFGYIVLQAGATLSGTWTFGVNNLSSVTGMTYTFVDIGALPPRPQVS